VKQPSEPTQSVINPDTGLRSIKYEHFQRIADTMNEIKLLARAMEGHGRAPNLTAKSIIKGHATGTMANPELREILDALRNRGFRRVNKALLGGGNALVLMGHNHQYIRIVSEKAKEEPRIPDPFVLQPVVSEELDIRGTCYRVEILPEVALLSDVMMNERVATAMGVNGDREATARELMHRLFATAHKEGYFLFDACPTNVGVIKSPSGKLVPMVVDAGAVVPLNAIEDYHWSNFYTRLGSSKFFPDFKHTSEPDYSFGQTVHAIKPPALEADFGNTRHVGYAPDVVHPEKLQAAQDLPFKKAIPQMQAYMSVLATAPTYEMPLMEGAQAAHLVRLELVKDEVKHGLSHEQHESAVDKYVKQRNYKKRAGVQLEPGHTPLQPNGYDAQDSLGARMLDQGVTPDELKSVGRAAQEELDIPKEGFCKKLRGVAKDRSMGIF
jgi:hypothetical protein